MEVNSKFKEYINNLDYEKTLKERLEAIKIIWPKFKIDEGKIVNDPSLKLSKYHKLIQDETVTRFYTNVFLGTNLSNELKKFAMDVCRFAEIDYKNAKDPNLINPEMFYDLIYTNKLDAENKISSFNSSNSQKLTNQFESTTIVSFLGANSKYNLFTDFLNEDIFSNETQRLAIKFQSKLTIIDFNSFDQKSTNQSNLAIDHDKMNKVAEDICQEYSDVIVCVVDPTSIFDDELASRMILYARNRADKKMSLNIVYNFKIDDEKELIPYRVKIERKYPKLNNIWDNEDENWFSYYKDEESQTPINHFYTGNPDTRLGKQTRNFACRIISQIIKDSIPKCAKTFPEKINSLLANLMIKPQEDIFIEKPEQSFMCNNTSFMKEMYISPTLGYTLYKKDKALYMEIELLGNTKFNKIIPNICKNDYTFTIKVSLSRWFGEFDKDKYIQDSRKKEIYEIETEPLSYMDFINDVDFRIYNEPRYDQGWVILSWGNASKTDIDLL